VGYQSRKRHYKSRGERNARNLRNMKVTALFIGIALLVLIYKNRHEIWFWLKTYFYYWKTVKATLFSWNKTS